MESKEQIFENLYSEIKGTTISFKERDRLNISGNKNFVYGEITFKTFSDILNLIKPQPGEKFYDLGSGSGKAVILASLLGNFEMSKGIEFLPGLCDLSKSVLKKFEEMVPEKVGTVQFIEGDITKVDWSDGDVIFANATCFDNDIWEKITKKFSLLKDGARVFMTSQSLNLENFEMIQDQSYEMSWGLNSMRIYKKKSKITI